MKRILDMILAHPGLLLTAVLGLAAAGYQIARTRPVDVFPDIRAPRVVVQTEAGGLTAEEVESRITVPIESAMNGIPGVTTVRSSSGGGLSFVWVDFDWSTDLSKARFAVFERLAAVRESLPAEADPEIAPDVSVTGEIMLIALTCPSNSVSPLALRELAEFDLRTRLMGVSGIGEVVVIGGRLPECRIAVDPRELAGYGLSLTDVADAARDARTFASAGYLPHDRSLEVPIRQIARADTLEELARVIVPTSSNSALRLGDVARLSVAGAPRRGSASFNGVPAVVLSVQKIPGGNTPELTKKLDAILDVFAALHRHDGVEVHREAYRQTDFINVSIQGGKDVVRDAILVVVLVLGLTLLKVRTILATLITMPISILIGTLIFPLFGLGVNVMTLGGLAVAAGDIVDCAIIFVEIVWRRLTINSARPESEREPVKRIISAAVVEVLPGVLFSTGIIVLVFLPLLFLSGLESSFFRPLALAYLSIFGASFIVSLFVTPVLSYLFWRQPKTPTTAVTGDSIAVRFLKALYRPFLRLALLLPKTLLCVVVLFFAGTLWMAAQLGSSFLPSFREDCFNVFISTPPGTSLDETERVTETSVGAIGKINGVLSVCRRTGRAERDQHAEPVSASELVVRVDLQADADRIAREIRDTLAVIPGVSTMVGYPIAHRISAVLSGTESELAINVFGDDLAVLRDTALKAKEVLEHLPQVVDVRANREIMTESLRVDYNLELLAEAGLTLREAGEQVSAAFNGLVVGTIRDGLRSRDIVVRLDAGARQPTAEDLKSFVLSARTGRRVRLDEVARIVPEESSNLIVHEGLRRKALISCNVAPGSNTGDLVAALRAHLEPVCHAAGCTVSYGGTYAARESAGRRLGVLGVGLFIVIFFLLIGALKSTRLALLALLNVPLSLMGGVIAVKIAHPVLSVSSLVGFITVVGFTLRNGILLLNRYQELQAQGRSLREAIEEGSLERMVPILMTSLTTVIGLVPIMLAAHKPGGELLAPLAVVQFGGLLGATVLNLLVLPAARILFTGTTVRPRAGLALVLPLLLLSGCLTYTPAPIDWAAEDAAWASTNIVVRLATIEDAEKLALAGNPDINRLRLKLASSESAVADAGWWEDPELNFDLNRIVQRDAHPFLGGASVSFTIPLTGVPKLARETAKLYAEADAWAVRAAEGDLIADVHAAAAELGTAERKRDALEAYLTDPTVTNALQQLQRLAEVGEFTPADCVTAKRALHARVHELQAARRAVADVLTEFRRLLGLPPQARILRAFPHVPVCRDQPVADVLQLARHPKVREKLARLGGTEAALDAEIRRQYPDLKIGPAYSREEGTDRIGLVAGLTLPLWNRNRKAIGEATAARAETRFDAIAVWRQLVDDAARAQNRLALCRQACASEGPEVPSPAVSAEEALRIFRVGELNARDYLARREEILDAVLSELDREAECARAAAALRKYEVHE